MKIGEKKSNTGNSYYVCLPKDQMELAKIGKGDNVSVRADKTKKCLIVEKLN